MTRLDDGGYDPATARRARRRKQAVVGVVGLAAVLGGGAFLATEVLPRGADRAMPDAGALAPTAASASASSDSVASASGRPSSRPSAAGLSRTPSAPASPKTAAERVAAARSAAASHGVPVQRPVPQAHAAAVVQDVTVIDSGSLRKDRGTLRVVSGRGDLTGQRELAWVADDGQPVGDARCTQTFLFADNAKPARKSNLLVCWRTSAEKSVYTVTVDLDGRPSKRDSVAALDKQWSRLG